MGPLRASSILNDIFRYSLGYRNSRNGQEMAKEGPRNGQGRAKEGPRKGQGQQKSTERARKLLGLTILKCGVGGVGGVVRQEPAALGRDAA